MVEHTFSKVASIGGTDAEAEESILVIQNAFRSGEVFLMTLTPLSNGKVMGEHISLKGRTITDLMIGTIELAMDTPKGSLWGGSIVPLRQQI